MDRQRQRGRQIVRGGQAEADIIKSYQLCYIPQVASFPFPEGTAQTHPIPSTASLISSTARVANCGMFKVVGLSSKVSAGSAGVQRSYLVNSLSQSYEEPSDKA